MPTITLLHCLRAASLRRWVLACVLMAWGCVWAAPLLHPSGLQVVCSASGHVKVITPAAAGGGLSADAHDCPLCSPPAAMPSAPATHPLPLPLAENAALACIASPASATPGALPPARGPPLR